MKTAVRVIVVAFLASFWSNEADANAAINPCPAKLAPHPTPIHSWAKGKELNLIFMSFMNFIKLTEITTGGTIVDIAEEPCFKYTGDWNETNLHFCIHGHKHVASYECLLGSDKSVIGDGCKPTAKSTNIEWAKKRDVGSPTVIWSDDKSYSLEVRCPKGKDQLWYVKSVKEVLTIEEQDLILNKVKSMGLSTDSAASFTNANCPKILMEKN